MYYDDKIYNFDQDNLFVTRNSSNNGEANEQSFMLISNPMEILLKKLEFHLIMTILQAKME